MNVLITSASRKVSLVRRFRSALAWSGGGNVVMIGGDFGNDVSRTSIPNLSRRNVHVSYHPASHAFVNFAKPRPISFATVNAGAV